MVRVINTSDVLINDWSNRITIQPGQEVEIDDTDVRALLNTYGFVKRVEVSEQEVIEEIEEVKPSKKSKIARN